MMEAYFKALAKRNASVTADAYNIWRTQNPTKRPNMDANKLAIPEGTTWTRKD